MSRSASAAAAPVDLGALDEREAGAAGGEAADVHQVPVRREPVVGGVLVHRRDANAVLERDAANGEWLEEQRCWHGRGLRDVGRDWTARVPGLQWVVNGSGIR